MHIFLRQTMSRTFRLITDGTCVLILSLRIAASVAHDCFACLFLNYYSALPRDREREREKENNVCTIHIVLHAYYDKIKQMFSFVIIQLNCLYDTVRGEVDVDFVTPLLYFM